MKLSSLADLTSVDSRILHFTPLPPGVPGSARPEEAVAMVQREVAPADLIDAVPEQTRRSFDRLRRLHALGAFCYDLFAVVYDQSAFVLEQALGERFVEFYQGEITLVKKDDTDLLHVRSFPDLYDELNGRGRHKGWKLKLRSQSGAMEFRGTLRQLFQWGQNEGLLYGQRNRHYSELLVRIRNRAAHPAGCTLLMDTQSARAIWDTAEIINCLWGGTTPGGRLYPAPLQREIMVLSWGADNSRSSGLAELLPQWQGVPDEEFLLVRACVDDPTIENFDAEFERTELPADWLWGPGRYRDALDWWSEHVPTGDEVQILDRLFVLRAVDGTVEPPRRVEVAAGLPDAVRGGRWWLVKAEFPSHALAHIRNAEAGAPSCAKEGPCAVCSAENLRSGSWQDVIATAVERSGGPIEPYQPPTVRVPPLWDDL
jgi:hypothetical protein